MVIEAKVKDPEKYKKYISQVPMIVAKYGGSYLVRGGKVIPILGDWTPERMIILKFPSETHIRTWLSSPEYQEISPLRVAGADIRAVLLEEYTEATTKETNESDSTHRYFKPTKLTKPKYTQKQGQYLAFIQRLHQTPWTSARGNRYAAIFQGNATFRAPNGAHFGESRTYRKDTWKAT